MNIWDYEGKGWLVIPTNLQTNSAGHNIMGAGLAKQAKQRYPEFAAHVGFWIDTEGLGTVWYNPETPKEEAAHGLFSFPTKYHWKENSSLELIDESAEYLSENVRETDQPYYFPRVGCGLGGLDWRAVRPVLEKHLSYHIRIGKVIFLEP